MIQILLILIYFFVNISYLLSSDLPCTIQNVVAKLENTVVNISTIQSSNNDDQRYFFDSSNYFLYLYKNKGQCFEDTDKCYQVINRNHKVISLGSGFLIDNHGHVVTNNHVIENAREINISIGSQGNKIYQAKVLGKDKKTDLALLKINTNSNINFVKFGNSDNAQVGDRVIAIGNAFGFGGTVTSGIISAKNRFLGGHFYEEFIQTDASINKGNSGGPMFNICGEVIGMNSAIISPTGGNVGVGFAIPSNIVRSISSKLLIDGKIERPWFGVTFQHVTDDMSYILNLNNSGVIVSNIIKGSPAEKFGIIVGDIIISFNGVKVRNGSHLSKLISDSIVGKNISLNIFRKGQILNFVIQLDFMKTYNKRHNIFQVSYLGMSFVNLEPKVRKQYNIDESVNGVLISNIDSSSNVFLNGLQIGDVIISINQLDISSTQDFISTVNYFKNSKSNTKAIFLISRQNNNFYTVIDLM